MDGFAQVYHFYKNCLQDENRRIIFLSLGDVVQYEENSYKILGRSSVDIIKSGGYKISALFVESVLLQNPKIRDVTVVGLPDPTWGQKVSYFQLSNH